jgi:hypothetical protein
MIEVKCETCGKSKLIKPVDAKRREHHFCDRVCYGNWNAQQQLGNANHSWKGGKKQDFCKYCKEPFDHYVHDSHKKQDFCSLKCYDEWRREQSKSTTSTCIICGKVKISLPSRLKKGQDKTCSKICEAILKSQLRIKDGNPNWHNGSSQEQYCPKFNKPFKEGVRAIWEYRCGLCGKPQSENIIIMTDGTIKIIKQSVHHVHYNKDACCNGDSNIWHFIPLCSECHGKTNGRREEYQQIFMNIILKERNGKSYLTEIEYPQYFAQKRLNSQLTVKEFLKT